MVVAIAVAAGGARARATPPAVRGLPFTRSYPLEEIGNVPRGARLTFDRFGRVALVQDGFYTVLNDTVWLDLEGRSSGEVTMTNVVHADDGQAYYTGGGSWGRVELTRQGKLHPAPLVPASPPKWVLTTNFNEIAITQDGVYFAGWNGVVYWDFAARRNRFFEIPRVAKLFRIGERVYVSSLAGEMLRIDGRAGERTPLAGTNLGEAAVDQATSIDGDRALVSTRDGRIFVFDGARLEPWAGQIRNDLHGRIYALQALVDGGVAVAITGRGLFLASVEGELRSALTSSEYHRITGLATREPGVLWAMAENAVEKVFYGSPISVFGQRLGLTASWPTVARWKDKIMVASSGRLFEAVPGAAGAASRFEPAKIQPAEGVWAIAADAEHLLVGNATGAYAAGNEGDFDLVAPHLDVARLVLVAPDLCFAIGRLEIAVLRWTDGRWRECAARIPAPGYASVVHGTRHAAWLELGANQVARVSLVDGRLHAQLFEFPWKDARWVNVGVVDDLIVLTGPPGQRTFFDENTEAFVDAPALRRLLERSGPWILRVRKDDAGTLWASHERGVTAFIPRGGDYQMDATTFDLNNEHFPFLQMLPGGDVWFATGQSLYHVERREAPEPAAAIRPMLVSVTDGRTNAELLSGAQPLRLAYAQNDLSFRFFAGSYAWRRPPAYEFRLEEGQPWRSLGTGSLLSFPGLREGSYHLAVRLADARGTPVQPVACDFEVAPPWHRTWEAYAACGLAAAFAVLGLLRWSVHRAHRRTLALEKLVDERTEQLTIAMQQLNEETRNAATLAERDRLAGEIHDNLQQGLSGLMLQLDATLKLPAVSGDVRSRLAVARNMVSFTRHEVQHAVWDLESPLLEDTELGEALRKLTTLIHPGAATIGIDVAGPAVPVPPATKHHLLRIAQEAITNAVRHGAARTISIGIEYRPPVVLVRVVDDGVGFNPDDVLANGIGHFGLRGLRGRANKIGGQLRITSSPGQGTTIEVTVPLRDPPQSSPNAAAAHT